MITPPVSPPPETEKPTDTPDGTSTTQQDGSVSSEDYILPQSNGTAMETFLPSKPQTSQHKFLAAGQKKSLSSGNLFVEKNESCNEENEDSAECTNDQISKGTGNDNTQVPNVKVDQGNETGDNIDLFNV